MRRLTLEERVSKLERMIKVKENVSLTELDCGRLQSVIDLHLKKFDCTCDVEDSNADYGFVNIGIYDNGSYSTEYDVSAVEYNRFEVMYDDKMIGVAKSYNDIGKVIATHYGKNF